MVLIVVQDTDCSKTYRGILAPSFQDADNYLQQIFLYNGRVYLRDLTMTSLPHKKIGVAVIRNQANEILIDRRLDKGDRAGLCEFPGGKVEAKETVEDCIAREIKEEINLDIHVGDRLMVIEHDYPKFRVSLHVHWCDYRGGEPKALECQEIRWVPPQELNTFDFPAANYQIITTIQEKLSTSKNHS